MPKGVSRSVSCASGLDELTNLQGAYETVYSLSEVAIDRIDTAKVFDRIVAGVGDDRGIRSLCSIMILKYSNLFPNDMVSRLDSLAAPIKAILATTLKDTAVRHEIERLDEAKRSVMRLTMILHRNFAAEGSRKPQWSLLQEEIRMQYRKMAEEVEKELRERQAQE